MPSVPPRLNLEIGLIAAVVAVEKDDPLSLVTRAGEADRRPHLPSGPFDPLTHRTLEIGLRSWLSQQTGLSVGYVEQLYTFGDRGRHARPDDLDPHSVSIGYLALTRRTAAPDPITGGAAFLPWYMFFPWEDWRRGRPAILDHTLFPLLSQWAQDAPLTEPPRVLKREERLRLCFGWGGAPWDEEKILERYELLYEAGLVEEALHDGRAAALARSALPALGQAMQADHRRILATAIARVRAKLKYRPVVFELMPQTFTLTALQHTVEAISGRHLHKQNFRRLVETAALVEPTGDTVLRTGGRPAALYRFRRNVVQERPAPGLRV